MAQRAQAIAGPRSPPKGGYGMDSALSYGYGEGVGSEVSALQAAIGELAGKNYELCICMYNHLHVCMYVCIHIYVGVYIYIYTDIAIFISAARFRR